MNTLIEGFSHFVTSMTAPIASGWSGCRMGFAAVRFLHPMACPSTNSEVQDLFAKLLEKRFDRQPCCAGILYECMRFLTGHYKVNAAEEFLSFECFRTEHRLVSAYINRIINVAWCFGHGAHAVDGDEIADRLSRDLLALLLHRLKMLHH